MRLGCVGCLLFILVAVILGIAAAGALFFSANIFEDLDIQAPAFSQSDGYRAQQKLYEVILREGGKSSRRDAIVLSERELNAFLSRHLLEAASLSFSRLSVLLLSDNSVEFRGRTELRNLLKGFPFAQIAPYLPPGKLDEPVWVKVRGRLRMERGAVRRDREYASLDVSEFSLGAQPMGVWLLQILLGGRGQNLFRWQVPEVVQAIAVEEGRLVIRTGPSS
jgi:hypothetical protein